MYGVVPAMAGEITSRLARFAKAHPRNGLAQFHYAMSLWKGQSAESADLKQVETLLRRAVLLDPKLAKGSCSLVSCFPMSNDTRKRSCSCSRPRA